MKSKTPKDRFFFAALAVLLCASGALFSGCDRSFEFATGNYQGDALSGSADQTLIESTTLQIDKEVLTATLRVPGAQDLLLQLAPRQDWFRGCPTSASRAVMETMGVTPELIQIGSIRIEQPLLVAECGLDANAMSNVSLVPAATPRNSGGGACISGLPCVFFRRL